MPPAAGPADSSGGCYRADRTGPGPPRMSWSAYGMARWADDSPAPVSGVCARGMHPEPCSRRCLAQSAVRLGIWSVVLSIVWLILMHVSLCANSVKSEQSVIKLDVKVAGLATLTHLRRLDLAPVMDESAAHAGQLAAALRHMSRLTALRLQVLRWSDRVFLCENGPFEDDEGASSGWRSYSSDWRTCEAWPHGLHVWLHISISRLVIANLGLQMMRSPRHPMHLPSELPRQTPAGLNLNMLATATIVALKLVYDRCLCVCRLSAPAAAWGGSSCWVWQAKPSPLPISARCSISDRWASPAARRLVNCPQTRQSPPQASAGPARRHRVSRGSTKATWLRLRRWRRRSSALVTALARNSQ